MKSRVDKCDICKHIKSCKLTGTARLACEMSEDKMRIRIKRKMLRKGETW